MAAAAYALATSLVPSDAAPLSAAELERARVLADTLIATLAHSAPAEAAAVPQSATRTPGTSRVYTIEASPGWDDSSATELDSATEDDAIVSDEGNATRPPARRRDCAPPPGRADAADGSSTDEVLTSDDNASPDSSPLPIRRMANLKLFAPAPPHLTLAEADALRWVRVREGATGAPPPLGGVIVHGGGDDGADHGGESIDPLKVFVALLAAEVDGDGACRQRRGRTLIVGTRQEAGRVCAALSDARLPFISRVEKR